MKDLLILGGGPAGAAAAVYASRKKIQSAIVTNEWGGQSTVSTDVQNWIGTPHIAGADIAKSLKAHVAEYADDVLEVVENDTVVSVKEIEGGFEVATQKGVVLQGQPQGYFVLRVVRRATVWGRGGCGGRRGQRRF